MHWIDVALLVLIVCSTLIGLARGLVRELFALGLWAAALLAAWTFHPPLEEWLRPWILARPARLAAALALPALGVLMTGSLLGHLLVLLVGALRLTWTDRLFGGLFGAARGLLILAAAAFLAALTPLPREPWWQDSRVIGRAQALAEHLLEALPPEVSERIPRG